MEAAPTTKRIHRFQAKPEDEGLLRCDTRYVSQAFKDFVAPGELQIHATGPSSDLSDISPVLSRLISSPEWMLSQVLVESHSAFRFEVKINLTYIF